MYTQIKATKECKISKQQFVEHHHIHALHLILIHLHHQMIYHYLVEQNGVCWVQQWCVTGPPTEHTQVYHTCSCVAVVEELYVV